MVTKRIFISYRREESGKDARHLATLLERVFGARQVFIDIKGLDGATDWLHQLKSEIASSAVVVALLCPNWANIRDRDGIRRLDSIDDFVKFELAEAFNRNIPVVPVLIDGAGMPSKEELPATLLPLLLPQAELLRSETFETDAQKISKRLERNIKPQRRLLVALLAALALTGLMFYGLVFAPQLSGANKVELVGVSTHFQSNSDMGTSAFTVADLKLLNRGRESITISRVAVAVDNISEFEYDPCPICDRVEVSTQYNVDLAGRKPGDVIPFGIFNLIGPQKADRINILFGGREGRSYLAKIRFLVNVDGAAMIESRPQYVIVFGNDRGIQIPDFSNHLVKGDIGALSYVDADFVRRVLQAPPKRIALTPIELAPPEWLK